MHLYIDSIFFDKVKAAGEKRLIMKSFFRTTNVSLGINIVGQQMTG